VQDFSRNGDRVSLIVRPLSSASDLERLSLPCRVDLSSNNFHQHPVVRTLPTGIVTLLLADIEGSTRLWDSQPDVMADALATMDRTLADLVHANNGVCPIEQGEGDSFVVAFTRPSDALRCALALQQAALAPIRLRIGVHTGEVRLRDEGKYMGPTINRAARLRELGHGGQILLSGTTTDLACDSLPGHAWLTDFGRRVLRDLPRPERVVQLCHPDLHNDFPPLRTRPQSARLTTFVGRVSELVDVRRGRRSSARG
jgi:class 3 adenylate cyclase